MSLQPGDTVDHFQVVRLLGQGGAGDVWLARDQVLGRKVALKVLRSTAEGATLHDLLDEARATATVVHPHVVTVYAVGSIKGVPYLALEFVDGVTLRQRLADRSTSTLEALRYARDIASALCCAHGEGVLHLDLKPDNVLIGSDGRLRVVDFGLARLRRPGLEEDRAGMSIAGTPAWMAPELWRGETPTEAADAWAFGVVLCELLTGQVPFPQARVSELVQALCAPQETPLPPLPDDLTGDARGLLARLLHKDPSRRPPLRDVVPVLEAALLRPTSATSADENPFRGLDAFREVDAARYFGREAEIESFVTQLATTPFLPIVGHSGAGKSSFVRAGVIPRLREGEPWLVVELRPGARPFLALARALYQARSRLVPRTSPSQEHPPIAVTLDDVEVTESGSGAMSRMVVSDPEQTEPVRALSATLAEAPERLYLELARLAKDAGTKVLLFVDQLEEAETLVTNEKTTQAFLHALAAAADDPADPVRVVVTVRDDFLGRLAAIEALRGAFGRVTVLRRPSLSALVESIISPLLHTGVAFDDGSLPLEMARAVEHEPAALPLLSFTCATLWEQRDVEKKRLLRGVYVRLGGVVGALATHADAVLDGLSPSQQRQARSLLLGLVTTERTRRRRSRRELLVGVEPGEGVGAAVVLDRLIAARLLTSERGQRDDDSEIELAHEALVRTWARLARFLDEEREQIDFTAELQQVADVWSRRGRRTSEVWTGAALQDALARVERAGVPLPETVRIFLDEGRREDRRRARQRSAVVFALVTFLTVTAAALFVARGRAVAAAREAQQARAVAEREAAEAALSRGDVWSARAKLRTSLELDDSREARALWRRLEANTVLFSATLAGSAIDGAFGSDGSVVIAHADDRVFSFAPGTFVQRDFAVWRDVRVSLNALALLGDLALVGMRDEGRVALVDLAAGRTLRVLDLHEGGVVAIVAVPARDVFVTAGRDGRMRIVSRDGVAQEPVLLHESGIDRIAVDPAGRRLWALGFNDTIVDVAIDDPDPEGLDPIPVGRDGRDLVVHPDGSVLVGAIDGTLLRHGPDRRLVPIANVGRIARLALDPNGRRLAVRADDGEVTLWALGVVDGVKGAYPLAFLMPGGVGGLGALSIDPSGTRLLTSTRDGDVRVWRIDDDSLQQRKDPKAPWNDVAISRDGRRVGEVIDGGIIVRDTASGDLVGYVGIDERIKAFALDRTGHKVLIGAGQRVIIHDLDGGDALSFVLDGGLRVGAFLDDGGAVIANGATLARLPPGSATPVATHALNELAVVLATNPDDTQVVIGGARGGAVLFDARDLSEVRRFSVADGASVTGVAFSTDGARLALATSTVLEVRAIADGSLVRRMPGERIVGVCTGFLPDGRVVDLRINAVVVANPDDGTSTVRFNVPATGSCQMTETGLMAMRLGDYVQPYDLVLDAPLWFSRGVVDGRISTQRGGPVWPPREFVAVTQVDAGPSHLCSAESGGAFVMRSADGGRVLARAVDPTSWPVVVASRNGCVWQQGDTLVRLRPSNDGGGVEVVAREVAAFGGGDGVVIAIGGGRLRIVDDQGGPERPLPTGGLVIDGGGAIGVSAGEVVHALPSGEIARWRLGHDEAPRIVRAATGDVMAVLPLPGGLIAAGTSGERVFVVDEDNGSIVIDESVRGAVQVLTIRREANDGGEQITLQAGTNLGNVQRLDLTPLLTPRCAMLRAVWAAAPVAWERGHPVPRPMPTDHPCATR